MADEKNKAGEPCVDKEKIYDDRVEEYSDCETCVPYDMDQFLAEVEENLRDREIEELWECLDEEEDGSEDEIQDFLGVLHGGMERGVNGDGRGRQEGKRNREERDG